jgi:hypothetical protein
LACWYATLLHSFWIDPNGVIHAANPLLCN